MGETRKKLAEAIYFIEQTELQFKQQLQSFEFNLNAFVNAARNITFVMQKEYSKVDGFTEWYDSQKIHSDAEAKKFINLRNISLKQKSISSNKFSIRSDFGPDGLRVQGISKVLSDPIKFDEPIPEFSYVTINDKNGERRVKYNLTVDFSVIEMYDDGKKTVEFLSFLHEGRAYISMLTSLIEDVEAKFIIG